MLTLSVWESEGEREEVYMGEWAGRGWGGAARLVGGGGGGKLGAKHGFADCTNLCFAPNII